MSIGPHITANDWQNERVTLLRTLTITINEGDFATQGAGVWNRLTTLGLNYVSINPKDADWAERAIARLQAFRDRGRQYDRVIIAGHGDSADLAHGTITAEMLGDAQSGPFRFFTAIGQALKQDEAEITFRCCSVASGQNGKDFLVLISRLTGATIRAYDDWYAIVPHGREWIAGQRESQRGEAPRAGKQYRPFKGTLIQRIWASHLNATGTVGER